MKRNIVNYIAAPLAALGLAIGSASVNAAPSSSSKQTQEGLYVLHFPLRGKIGTVGVAEAGADYSGKHVPTKKVC